MRELLRLAKRIPAASPGTTIDQSYVPRGNLYKLQISAQNQLSNARLQAMEEETRAWLKHKREDESSSPWPPPSALRTAGCPKETSPLLTMEALKTAHGPRAPSSPGPWVRSAGGPPPSVQLTRMPACSGLPACGRPFPQQDYPGLQRRPVGEPPRSVQLADPF